MGVDGHPVHSGRDSADPDLTWYNRIGAFLKISNVLEQSFGLDFERARAPAK
ncbi:hypothetical protein TRAPUB_9060 [Trametes pubescens]|uniref:Uncharacterized protein n=1 Tax=Trametes pubescens TaxID=154538 RepID=A0A1M2W3F9_TRAPU|nr:hypothetical protein TRAPUB_9060 [Trametes pubescens]